MLRVATIKSASKQTIIDDFLGSFASQESDFFVTRLREILSGRVDHPHSQRQSADRPLRRVALKPPGKQQLLLYLLT